MIILLSQITKQCTFQKQHVRTSDWVHSVYSNFTMKVKEHTSKHLREFVKCRKNVNFTLVKCTSLIC